MNSALGAGSNWKSVGDQCSKEFFQSHQTTSNASHITELQDQHGQSHTSQAAMAQVCSDYYKKLYTARESPKASVGARDVALRYLLDKLSPSTKMALQAPMSQNNLRTILRDMRSSKSPGPDGIVLEFYKVFWNMLEAEYIVMINESIQEGRLPPGVTQGKIAFLHKGGDRHALTNWKPITLLNLSLQDIC